MELLDRNEMTKSVWPVIKKWAEEVKQEGKTNGHSGQANGHANGHANGAHKARHVSQLDALIAATCDDFGYAFNWRTVKVSRPRCRGVSCYTRG